MIKHMGPNCYSCTSKTNANFLIVKWHFRSLHRFSTAPVLTALSTDVPTHMEPSFNSETHEFCVKNTRVLPATNTDKNAFFSHNCLLHLLETVLLYKKFLVAFHTVVFGTYTCWAKRVRDSQGEFSNLAAISWNICSVNAAFCPVCLSPQQPSCAHFANWMLRAWTPGYLRKNLLYTVYRISL
jgi:hypothetical protein